MAVLPEPSVYISAVAVAWIVSQLIKYLLHAMKSKSLSNVASIYQSGSMPSVHSAVMSAVTTTIGIIDGVGTGLFALAAVLTVVVMYDAMQVRRAVGEQGLALAELLERAKSDKKPYHALGHKPLEVAVGVMIGVAVAFFITHLSS